MRVAALSDVHGNVRALEAVLADARDVTYLLEGKDDWTAQQVPADVVRDLPLTLSSDGAVYCDRIVNPGSVGLPTVRAVVWWALVDSGNVELRTTEYDTVANADAMRRSSVSEADEVADEVVHPPTVEQLLERLP